MTPETAARFKAGFAAKGFVSTQASSQMYCELKLPGSLGTLILSTGCADLPLFWWDQGEHYVDFIQTDDFAQMSAVVDAFLVFVKSIPEVSA